MGGRESPLDRHWTNFEALRRDCGRRQVELGVDRGYVRRWAIVGGEGSPLLLRVIARLLLLLAAACLLTGAYVAWLGLYLMSLVLFITAFLSARFMTYVTVSVARATAMKDERLFRKWFQERRLSLFVKASGEYVWNDSPGDV